MESDQSATDRSFLKHTFYIGNHIMFETKVEPPIALGFNLDFRKTGLKLSILYNSYYKK